MKQQSPFKFLDAYQQADKDVFFGREQETNDLNDALSGVKHLLVYGPSGAGKTSLIECGLRNQFSDADWFALSIRRGENINASVFARINEALEEKIALNAETQLPEAADISFGELIEQLFEERFQPVYLLFDQFEELLILGNDAEKKEFFTRLNQLIRYKVPCRILLIMREEFIGHLSEFEALCPSIFKHRFRLEKMRKEKVRGVINEMLEAEEYEDFYEVRDSTALANAILAKLPDQKKEIELTHVQVFLSELWDRAKQQINAEELPLLQPSLVTKEDDLEGVLNSFLKKQLQELNASAYGENTALEILASMISERHTKLQISQNAIRKDLESKKVKIPTSLPQLLQDLEKRRLIRSQKAGEQTQYEISHDLLALAVGQNLTEEMQMRQKAGEVYAVYAERQGYFSQEDLDFIRPYHAYKAYPTALEGKIRESEVFLKEKQERELQAARNQSRRLGGLLVAAVLALGFAGWQYWEADQAQKETLLEKERAVNALILAEQKAWETEDEAEEGHFQKISAEYQQYLAVQSEALAVTAEKKAIAALADVEKQKQATEIEKEKALEAKEEAEKANQQAQENLELAKTNEQKAIVALADVEKQKKATEAEKEKAVAARDEAVAARAEAEQQKQIAEDNLQKVQEKNKEIAVIQLKKAEQAILALDYKTALQKIEAGAKLEVGSMRMEVVKAYMELAFWYAETHQYAKAEEILQTALEHQPNAEAQNWLQKTIQVGSARTNLQEALKTLGENKYKELQERYYPKMMEVEGGIVEMGVGENFKVKLSDFKIAQTETTVFQFALYCAVTKLAIDDFLEASWSKEGIGLNPIINVSWYQAVEYSNWLSNQKGRKTAYVIDKINKDPDNKSENDNAKWTVEVDIAIKNAYRLPTEAEWEYAAKGGRRGKNTMYSGSDDPKKVAVYKRNTNQPRTHSVATLKPNELGLYDMSGNVWEWCFDWSKEYPSDIMLINYFVNKSGSHRVFRGGGWYSPWEDCCVAYRGKIHPLHRGKSTGFRVAYSL